MFSQSKDQIQKQIDVVDIGEKGFGSSNSNISTISDYDVINKIDSMINNDDNMKAAIEAGILSKDKIEQLKKNIAISQDQIKQYINIDKTLVVTVLQRIIQQDCIDLFHNKKLDLNVLGKVSTEDGFCTLIATRLQEQSKSAPKLAMK